MIWETENGRNHAKNVDFLIIIIAIFSLFGIVTQNPLRNYGGWYFYFLPINK